MSLASTDNMVMPVTPMGGYGYGNGSGLGWGGDGSFWIIILFLFAMFNGGWGNGFGGGYNNGGMFPYMMNNTTNNDMQRGFDQQSIMGGINGITNALANAEVSRCNNTANITTAMNAGFTGISNGMNSGFTGLANGMNAGFTGVQTALANNQMAQIQAQNQANLTQLQNTNQLAASLQQCCCNQAANTNDLKYSIATEACADRQAVNDGVRDIIAQNTNNTNALMNTITAGIQSINDKLCQQEIDALKTQNQNLKTQNQNLTTQLNMANLAASQGAQTSALQADNAAQTQALLNRINQLNPAPVPAYVVSNPNGCQCGNYYPNYQQQGCGCGCGSF